MWSVKFKKSVCFNSLVAMITVAVMSPLISAYCANPYEIVSSWFAETDNLLRQTAQEIAPIGNLGASETLLNEKIANQPAFEVLLRTNSKGKVISEVTQQGIQQRSFRTVGTQRWHRGTEASQQTYYGMLLSGGSLSLFWVRPLATANNRFGGTLVARVNVEKALRELAQKHGVSFAVEREGNEIFSNLDVPGAEKRPLLVPGIDGLVMSYGKTSAAALPQEHDAVGAEEAVVAQTVGGAEGVGGAEQPSALSWLESENVPVAAVGAVVAVGLLFMVIALIKGAKGKQKRLLESIEKGDV